MKIFIKCEDEGALKSVVRETLLKALNKDNIND